MKLPRLAGLDLETTGLDLKKDRILKMGIVITEGSTSLLEKEWILFDDTYPESTKEALDVHSIKREHSIEFGGRPREAYEALTELFEKHSVDYIVAHNGTKFDFPMLYGNLEAFHPYLRSHFQKIKKIDTTIDVPYPSHIKTRKLNYLAIEHGFMNPFPHSTLSDVRTMLKILQQYSWNEVLLRSQSPTIVVQAVVDFNTKDLAKARGFQWNAENKKWTKSIKEIDWLEEIHSDFNIEKIAEGK